MSLQTHAQDALARDPGEEEVEFNGRWYTWGELRSVADKVNVLLDEAGLDPRAPVGFIPRNRPSAIAAELGMLASGRTIRMIYAFQSPVGAARDVGRLKLSAVVAAPEEFSPEVRAVIREQGLAAIAIQDMDAWAVAGAERCTATMDPDAPEHPTVQVLTSGTTGPPKHVSFPYELIHKHMVGINVSSLTRDASAPPALLYFPLGNVSGVYSIVPPLLNGSRVVLLDRFTLEGWRDYVRRYQPRNGGLPPAGIRMVLDADLPKAELASIKVVMTGAAPLDPTIQKAFEDKYEIPILLSYGATEFGGPVTAMTLDLYEQYGRAKLGTVGKPFNGATLRVVDAESGQELPAGQEGVLEVISPRIGPDWIRTSDIAMIDEDGFIFHRGRADGAIVRGGFKLLPETIERALVLHPAVSLAAVVGVPDDRLGQVPAAAIQLKPGMEQPPIAELEQHLRDHVFATHIPTKWRFVTELPRTVSFKVDLNGVRRLFGEASAAG